MGRGGQLAAMRYSPGRVRLGRRVTQRNLDEGARINWGCRRSFWQASKKERTRLNGDGEVMAEGRRRGFSLTEEEEKKMLGS